MAADPMPFAREEGDAIICVWEHVEIVIPESFFSTPALADDFGGKVETLGFVGVRARESDGSPLRYFDIRLPARLVFQYSESGTDLDEFGEPVRVFSSKAGEVLVHDVNVVQSSENVSEIFRALATARVRNASYTDFAGLFIEGSRLNGAGTGVTRGLMEALISEMARWSSDATVPLRIPLATGKATERDFRFVRLKDLPRLNSVFTGIGFEDITLSTQAAVRKSTLNEPQVDSPMEEIVRY